MRVECVEINTLVSVHQSRAFGDRNGLPDPLSSRLRYSSGQNSQCNDVGRESETHSEQEK